MALPQGYIVFRVDVIDDEGDTSFDEVVITVASAASGGDVVPFAYAGTDLILNPSTTTAIIDGRGNDPDGGAVTYQWVQLDGPSSAINGVSDVADLTLDGLVEGEYRFRLSVTDDEGNTISDDVDVSIQLPGDIWLEAECATSGFLWSEVDDANVSNGKYLVSPDGENFQTAPTNDFSWVSFDFMAEAGSYSLYGLVNAPGIDSDSFWVRINNGQWINWNGLTQANGFIWNQLYDSNDNGAIVTLVLESGSNRIDFANREAGVSLDKIYLTKSGDAPNGLGGKDFTCTAPKIRAYFNNQLNLSKSYGGSVDVILEALENDTAGAIESVEYLLDTTTLFTYTAPFTVSGEGLHRLSVTATNINGNVSRRSYEFIIEPMTGARLEMENMTKVPGTDRGFPADDYYSFHRTENPGATLIHDANTMRLNNTGSVDLIVSQIDISNTDRFSYILRDEQGSRIALPITVMPGSYADLDITFIANSPVKGLIKETIAIVSNADNSYENHATLHGTFMLLPENVNEISAEQVLKVFGFQTNMLSLVNDQGTIVPPNRVLNNPRLNFPIASNIDAGYEGDLILADSFVQANPNKPVIGMQLAAFHGPVSDNARLKEVDGVNTVAGMSYNHGLRSYQTIFPTLFGNINSKSAATINEPFAIEIGRYPTTGGVNAAGDRPDLLGARVYKVRDHNGQVIPNEYIVLQDFVQSGCNENSPTGSCDWNDNIHYFINIRPSGTPKAAPVPDIVKNTNESFGLDLNDFFNTGHPGNTLTYSGTTSDGNSLPNWMGLNSLTGEFSGKTLDNPGSYTVLFNGIDPNGFTAVTSLIITVLENGTTVVAKSIDPATPLNNLTLYPNPASISTTLGFDMPTQVERIQVFDVSGRLVKTIKGGLVDRNGTPIDVHELPTGTYYINTRDSSGQEFKQQMLIMRNK